MRDPLSQLVPGPAIGNKKDPAPFRKRLYDHCTIIFIPRKLLIISEMLVEVTGVELFNVLAARNLLIPGTATTAKKAPLPDPLYVYCTKCFAFGSQPARHNDRSIP